MATKLAAARFSKSGKMQQKERNCAPFGALKSFYMNIFDCLAVGVVSCELLSAFIP